MSDILVSNTEQNNQRPKTVELEDFVKLINELEGITDCHMHLIGPEQEFPFSPGYEGVFQSWSTGDYLPMAQELGIQRYVITQTPFYGFDNRNLLYGLKQLGNQARGIAVVSSELPDSQFQQLSRSGVVGCNFYLFENGELDWSVVAPTNERIQDLHWQTQLQFNGQELSDRYEQISALKGTLVIDHIGKFQPTVALDNPSFRALCRLLESGRCYVKLSAPYESSSNAFPYEGEAGQLARFLIAEYPERLVWGSNWPHLGLKQRNQWPKAQQLLYTLLQWGADRQALEQILVINPARLFGFD